MLWFYGLLLAYVLGEDAGRRKGPRPLPPRKPVQLDMGFPDSYAPESKFNWWYIIFGAVVGAVLVALIGPLVVPLMLTTPILVGVVSGYMWTTKGEW